MQKSVTLAGPPNNYQALHPTRLAFVAVGSVCAGALVMLAEAWRDKDERMPLGVLGVIALVSSAIALAFLWNRNTSSFNVILADNFGIFVSLVLAVVGVLTIAFSSQVIERDGLPAGEYYARVLFALVGMMMMATANDLLVIFIALEILSHGIASCPPA